MTTTNYNIVRDIKLPATDSILALVDAVRGYYRVLTGLDLDYREAIRCLDRIHTERGSR
jgi:hypothetical protein